MDHVSHSSTSRESAAKTRKSRGLKKLMILHLLQHTEEGLTSFEAEEFFGWSHQTVSSALSHAEEEGLICRSGNKRVGPSGQKSYVYYDIEYVRVEDRLPVIRRGVPVFDWNTKDAEHWKRFLEESEVN